MRRNVTRYQQTGFSYLRWMGLLCMSLLVGCPQMDPPPGVKAPGQATKQATQQRQSPQKRPPAQPRKVAHKSKQPSRQSPTSQRAVKIKRDDNTFTQKNSNPKQDQLARRLMAMGAGRSRGGAIRPVYHETGLKASVLIKQFCDALYGLPVRAQKKCCSSGGFGFLLIPQCIRNMTAALHSKAVRLRSSRIKPCIAAMKKAHEGCDWVGHFRHQMPKACFNIFIGTLDVGAKCRSSLECKKGFHCYGLGTTMAGKCTVPPHDGVRCGSGVDTLATFTRQHNLHDNHPLCRTGYCARYVCRPWKKKGQACRNDIQCKPGHFCDGSQCIQGPYAKLGASCTGKCPPGARCIKGTCQTIKKAGEVCTNDYECRGGCVPVPGKKIKRCGKRCPTLSFKTLRKTNRKTNP